MTRAITAPAHRRPSEDRGFTLIEVIVALFLLGVVATAVLVFFIRGLAATSHIQRTQSADAVATQAMEQVRSVLALAPTGGTSGVVIGRTQTAVMTTWNAANPADTADSAPAWDNSPTAASTPPTVPILQDVVRSGITYHVTTLIGTCDRIASPESTDQSCVKPPAPGVPILRVIVVVTWTPASAGECSGTTGLCTYSIRSLLDPTADPAWNLTTTPIAYPDDMGSTTATTPWVDSAVVANDLIGPVTTNPISNISTPSYGLASAVYSAAAPWMLRYKPNGGSGLDTFSYNLIDAASRSSNLTSVTIRVTPVADDVGPLDAVIGATTTIDMSAYVHGTFASSGVIITCSIPTVGSCTSLGGKTITYQAPAVASAGSAATFTYTIKDHTGYPSNTGAVKITLKNPLPVHPGAPALSFNIVASRASTMNWTPLDILNDPSVTGASSNSTIAYSGIQQSGGGNLQGTGTSVISYQPPSNRVGIFTFTYTITNSSGLQSKPPANTITLNLMPKANDLTQTLSHGVTLTGFNVLDPLVNDIPSTTPMKISVGTESCGSAWVWNGLIQFSPPGGANQNNAKSCSVPYTITPSGLPSLATQATLTVNWSKKQGD